MSRIALLTVLKLQSAALIIAIALIGAVWLLYYWKVLAAYRLLRRERRAFKKLAAAARDEDAELPADFFVSA